MNITLIGPVHPYRGGIAHYTTLLAKHLQSAGHQVQVMSFKRQYPAWLYPGTSDRDTSRQPLTVPAEYDLDPLYPWTWVRAARKIARGKPDLVVIQWWTTFWSPAFAAIARMLKRSGLRVVYLVHNVMPHETRFWDRRLAQMALSAARTFVVQTGREASRLRSLLPGAEIVISPHPVYDVFSDQRPPREEARAALGLPAQGPVALFFGIVRPYKGLRYLLQAVHVLKKRGSSVNLLVAGEFWEPVAEYRDLVNQLGIQDCVHIHNRYIPNEEIPTFFGAADLFVAPYVDGTQSGSAKMALGFSIPMVLTECVVDETLALQEAVWQAKERDPYSLADAMISALNDTGARHPHPSGDDWSRAVRVIEAL